MTVKYNSIPSNNDSNYDPNFDPAAWESGFLYHVKIAECYIYLKNFFGLFCKSFKSVLLRDLRLQTNNIPHDHPFFPQDPAIIGYNTLGGLQRREYTMKELCAHNAWLEEHNLSENDYQAMRKQEQKRVIHEMRIEALKKSSSPVLEVRDTDDPFYGIHKTKSGEVYKYPDIPKSVLITKR